MDGLPVTIRLLDPPLHEFVPQGRGKQTELATGLASASKKLAQARPRQLHEINPMMGHRGVRLGITYPGDHRDADPGHLRGGRRNSRQEGKKVIRRS